MARSSERRVRPGTGRSLIKPHLVKVSGSGKLLNGLIVERSLEQGLPVTHSGPARLPGHMIVLPRSKPSKLEWTASGRRKSSLFLPGELVINPNGNAVAPRWDIGTEIVLLLLEPGYLEELATRKDAPGPVDLTPRFQFRDPLVEQLLVALVAEFEQEDPPNLLYTESLSNALLTHVIHKYAGPGNLSSKFAGAVSRGKLAAVIDYIHEHLDQRVSLDTLASLAELSPSHFSVMFKRSVGVAPHQYLMTQRVERAKVLLGKSHLSIAQIAAETGFADQSHMTRVMRRHSGITPGMIRDD